MKLTTDCLEHLATYHPILRHSLEPMHGWRSSHDEGGHTHCENCSATIYRGDPVVGRYLQYVSIVFCPECVTDNPQQFDEWIASSSTND